MWKDYVTALVQHSRNSTTAHIHHWEMWNEPHNNFYWNGTSPQLVRVVADAYAIIKASDPIAIVLSPTVGWEDGDAMKWFQTYIAAGGAKYIDRISCHGYSKQGGGKYGPPENMVKDLVIYRASLTALGLGSIPIWDTEADWGQGLMTDYDMEAAWISRFYVLHASNKIRRLYWFIWNGGPQGGLWTLDPKDHRLPGPILKPGIAYGQVETRSEDSREMPVPHKTLRRAQAVATRGSQEFLEEEVPARHLSRCPRHEHSSSPSIPPRTLRPEQCLSSPLAA